MAVISLFSAKGSPGVTTAVVALTMAWGSALPGRSALAVDLDPIGGDTAAGVLRGAVSPDVGVLSLATARDVEPVEALDSASIHLRADASARLVPGVPDAARAAAIPLAWDVVERQRGPLHHAGCDVLVDGGRISAHDAWPSWLGDSDMAALVVRPTLPSVTAAHRLAAGWAPPALPLHLVLVDGPSPYRPDEVADAVGRPLVAIIPFDADRARVHSEGVGPRRGFDRSEYARGVQRAAAALGSSAGDRARRHLPAPGDPAAPGARAGIAPSGEPLDGVI